MRSVITLGLVAFIGCGNKSTHHNGNDMATGASCGDGKVDPGESCDDGAKNGAAGDPCTNLCQWSCSSDANCDDHNACNGAETCSAHVCAPGIPPGDGAACGGGMICRGGTCIASRCGDGIVTPPEECDNGTGKPGSGCDADCRFICVSTDPARNCTPKDACMGQGTCDDATHDCAPGQKQPDGTHCGTGNDYCKAGVCTAPVCGNRIVEPGEDCDDGGLNGTKNDPCNASCGWACVTPAIDCAAPPVCELFNCNAHLCQAVADPTQNGKSCGSSLFCKDGACISQSAVCGNGVLETGEECDFGKGNGPNTGCETNCKFSCHVPSDCDDGNACTQPKTCDPVTVNSQTGHKCNYGAPVKDGTNCGTDGTGTDKICLKGACNVSRCGDGFVDPNAPWRETCDPPTPPYAQGGCDSRCHVIKCGDGQRQDSEQCDDGNTTNLDGCDGQCRFEQDHRANSLTMQFDTTLCAPDGNALGGAIVDQLGLARTQIQNSLNSGVKAGSISILVKFIGLDDLSGTKSTNPFQVGVFHASPVAATGYDGTNDIDWWYTSDTNTLDGSRNPKSALMNGSFNASALKTDPGTITMQLNIAGSPATLTMYNTKLTASATNTPPGAVTPTMSTGATPGHLATENLDPTLKSFPALSGGKICGDISATSLAGVVAPKSLQQNCSEGFNANNSLLDVLVVGCHAFGATEVASTQPDGPTDGANQPLYTFTVNGSNQVTGCAGPQPWPTCRDLAWYSSAFAFTTDRVIAK